MSSTKAAAKVTTSSKKSENDEKSRTPKRANNVTIGTLTEVKGAEGDGSENGGYKLDEDQNYVYRDFSQIPEEDFDVDYEIDQEGLLQALEDSTALAAAQTMQQAVSGLPFLASGPPVMRASGWVRSQRFPVKLYALLSQPNLSHVITWMPHGRSWKVLKPKIFETAVLPVFFESDNYHSFNRVINAWSFRRKSSGPDRGSYFHELFLRGKPHLQKYMRRLPRTHKKLNMKKEEEPDFFELEKSSPLPSLEEAKAALELRKVQRIRDQFQREASQVAQTNVFLAQSAIPHLAFPPGFPPTL